jgi:zinc transporter 9
MSLSQSQLRLISSIGVGILVGTSLVVIIPEGIDAIVVTGHGHGSGHTTPVRNVEMRWNLPTVAKVSVSRDVVGFDVADIVARDAVTPPESERRDSPKEKKAAENGPDTTAPEGGKEDSHSEPSLPTFYIGFSLVLGFVLMFLIDRLPRHATENFKAAPATRHISLDDLASSAVPGDEEESHSFLGSLAPTPKQSRSLATTTGLVIHAAADGIAMGASSTTSNMKLGLIIFIAIMVHKAPAAFGLTSVLLKQGLSKRAARGHLIVFSLAAPVGAITTYLLISIISGTGMEGESGQWWTGMLLLFSAGTFL